MAKATKNTGDKSPNSKNADEKSNQSTGSNMVKPDVGHDESGDHNTIAEKKQKEKKPSVKQEGKTDVKQSHKELAPTAKEVTGRRNGSETGAGKNPKKGN